MIRYEYRVIPAPDRTGKARKKGSDPFAETLSDLLNSESRAGWEYLRAETLPLRERAGLTGSRMGFRTMLVFRRPAGPDAAAEDESATRDALKLLENRAATPDAPMPQTPVADTPAPPKMPQDP